MSIAISQLCKSFQNIKALDNINLHVSTGSFCCVVGPSGCGKSTLLRLIAGLDVPDKGQLLLNGDLVCSPDTFIPPEDRQVGVVFQSYALWPHMTVLENVSFPYQARGLSRAEAQERAINHLNTVSLEDFALRKPEALSGGQRQRVALARCLAGDVKTVLMDEPLANLDPHLRESMEVELRQFHDNSGVTTIYITHDQREAMSLADFMVVMEAGCLSQTGTPQDIYEKPNCRSVAAFVGRGVLIPAMVKDGMARLCQQDVPVSGQGEGHCQVFFRPHQIQIADEGWPVVVISVHYRGGVWESIARGEGMDADLTLELRRQVLPGDILTIQFLQGWILPDTVLS